MKKLDRVSLLLLCTICLLVLSFPRPVSADHGYIVNRVCGDAWYIPEWATNRMESVSWWQGDPFEKYAESHHFLNGQRVDVVPSGWVNNWHAVAFHIHGWVQPGAEVQGWHGFRAHGIEYWKWGWADGCVLS